MKAALIVFAYAIAQTPGLAAVHAASPRTPSPRCCCCSSAARCQCGCDPLQNDDTHDTAPKAMFCACHAQPASLPSAPMKPSTPLAPFGRVPLAAWTSLCIPEDTIREVWLDMHSPPAELIAIHATVLRI